MTALALLTFLGCAGGQAPSVHSPDVWIEQARVGSGEAVVLHVPTTTQLPELDTLRVTERSRGDDGTTVYELRGQPGSYVLDVPSPSGEPVRLFFDIGVEGPSAGALEDLAPMEPPTPSRWPWAVAGLAGLAGTVIGLVWAARRLRPPAPPPPPEAPDVRARREWNRLRARTDLSPDALALALSDVYRRYLDDTRPWPASARTTRELLDNLAADLSALDLDRARRLLGAMDLVKFSERGAHAALFEQLDADFGALVVSVRAAPVSVERD